MEQKDNQMKDNPTNLSIYKSTHSLISPSTVSKIFFPTQKTGSDREIILDYNHITTDLNSNAEIKKNIFTTPYSYVKDDQVALGKESVLQ